MKKFNVKNRISEIEILGAEVLLNKCLTSKYLPNDDLFITGNCLNSTECANGNSIEIIDDYFLSHLQILDNSVVIAIAYDNDDNEKTFRVDYNSFTEL